MNNDKQRIAIAKACGYTDIRRHCYHDKPHISYGISGKFPAITKTQPWIPNYPNDLNAMHEAEEVLSVSDQVIYRGNLWNLTTNKTLCIRSTASQRAEAFLRTIGKWEEEG